MAPISNRPSDYRSEARAVLGETLLLQRYDRFVPLRGPQPFFETRSFIASISSVLPGDDPLHSRVLGLELFKANEIARLHPRVLIAPEPDSVGVNAMLARQFGGRRSAVEFLEDRDDLRFGEAASLHVSILGPEARNSQFQSSLISHPRSVEDLPILLTPLRL
jgi:hypothetical protein